MLKEGSSKILKFPFIVEVGSSESGIGAIVSHHGNPPKMNHSTHVNETTQK